MFCGECGAKNQKGSKFCENCGSKIEVEKTSKKQEKKVQERKPMSKKTKTNLIVVGALIVVIIGVCIFLGSLTSPKNIAEKLFKATTNYDYDTVYEFLDVEKSAFTTKDMFRNLMTKEVSEQNKKEVVNYTVSNPVLSNDQMTATVTITYLLKDESDSNTFNIKLVKSKDKKWLFFDNWKVVMDGIDMAHDYKIQVVKGSKVTVEGINIGEEYLDKESSTEQLDVYKMPVMFEMEYDIVIDLPTGIKKEDSMYVMDEGRYKYKLSVSDLSDSDKSKFIEISKTNLQTLYNGVKDKKTFDEIKSSFEYEGGDLEILKEVYNRLVKAINANLTSIDFTDVNLMSISLKSSGDMELYLKAKYNYTISYEESGEVKTHDSSDYDYLYLTYTYVNNEYKLVNATGLNTYFSKYY